MACKGICEKHKAHKRVGTSYYGSGFKRCQGCSIFVDWDGIYCPCCGQRLRLRARNRKYRNKNPIEIEVKHT